LLFIDNLAEITSTERDEYTKQDAIMRRLSDLREYTNTTIVLLHHFAKPKLGEPITINSVKGNNIIITKADVAVGIDKQKVPNFNWRCHWKDSKGELVEKAILRKFESYAPKIETRAIYTFKDRYYGDDGLQGYMRLGSSGMIEFLSERNMRDEYPLTDKELEKIQVAFDKYNLKPMPEYGDVDLDDDIAEALPWDN
jgi:hypothetical protein